jgi:hypothetical protein
MPRFLTRVIECTGRCRRAWSVVADETPFARIVEIDGRRIAFHPRRAEAGGGRESASEVGGVCPPPRFAAGLWDGNRKSGPHMQTTPQQRAGDAS